MRQILIINVFKQVTVNEKGTEFTYARCPVSDKLRQNHQYFYS